MWGMRSVALCFALLLLTPSHQAEFEQVSPDVDVEDSDQEQVEVEPFQSHPSEGGQQ